MVGKPNLSQAGDDRPDLYGAANPTPGLAALDQEREASMADEGGAAGAAVESELGQPLELATPSLVSGRRHRRLLPLFAVGFVAGTALGIWTYRRSREV